MKTKLLLALLLLAAPVLAAPTPKPIRIPEVSTPPLRETVSTFELLQRLESLAVVHEYLAALFPPNFSPIEHEHYKRKAEAFRLCISLVRELASPADVKTPGPVEDREQQAR
jgi:hypothetical protein